MADGSVPTVEDLQAEIHEMKKIREKDMELFEAMKTENAKFKDDFAKATESLNKARLLNAELMQGKDLTNNKQTVEGEGTPEVNLDSLLEETFNHLKGENYRR